MVISAVAARGGQTGAGYVIGDAAFNWKKKKNKRPQKKKKILTVLFNSLDRQPLLTRTQERGSGGTRPP